jgi:endonuclease YncB( thermonuclease family)
MNGYDSPEIKTQNQLEKMAGLRAKQVLRNRIENKIVQIEILPMKDKYGRLLANISDQEGQINKWMLDNNYGRVYSGGTKEKFESELIIEV